MLVSVVKVNALCIYDCKTLISILFNAPASLSTNSSVDARPLVNAVCPVISPTTKLDAPLDAKFCAAM